jgi:type I restriction enzyme S subunit
METDFFKTTIGEQVTLQRGFDITKKHQLPGCIPVVSSGGPSSYHNEAKCKGPGVVLGRKGSLGTVFYLDTDYWPHDTSLWVKDFKGNNPQYVYYFFKSVADILEKMDVGAANPSLNRNHVHSLPTSWTNHKNQREIVRILSSLDDKIILNRRTNQTLEQISQAIFKSWFIDFEPVKAKDHIRKLGGNSKQIEKAAQAIISGAVNLEDILKGSDLTDIKAKIESKLDAKLKLQTNEQQNGLAETAELFPEKFVESELGFIPEGCVCSNVKDILKRLKPPKRYTKQQVQPYGEVPVFEQGAGLLLGFHNDLPGFEPTLNNPIFIFGDHTCLMHISIGPFDISQNVIPIQGKARSTIWVYYAVKDLQKFQEYRRHWSELIVKKIVISPKPLCTVFEKVVTTNHLKIEKNHIQNEELKRIRDALLPKLLSGEIKVNV